MRKRSKGFALARNTGSPLKMSGVIAQPARPRSTASELYTSQPRLTKKFNQPSRPSGVVSYVTPVSPPPCHIKSGTAPRRFAGRKYCTYIASTAYVPLRSTFAGTPPGVNTTSFTGLPLIVTSRPPTWNEPMSRNAMGLCAQPASSASAKTARVLILPPSKLVTPQPAVDRDHRAGDVARARRGEEADEVRDVLGLAVLAHRDVVLALVLAELGRVV